VHPFDESRSETFDAGFMTFHPSSVAEHGLEDRKPQEAANSMVEARLKPGDSLRMTSGKGFAGIRNHQTDRMKNTLK
jgi:hypothetical protein